MISSDIHIMTDTELRQRLKTATKCGIDQGKWEEWERLRPYLNFEAYSKDINNGVIAKPAHLKGALPETQP